MAVERVTTVGSDGDIVVLEFAPEPRTPEEKAEYAVRLRRAAGALADLLPADLLANPPVDELPASAGDDDEPVAAAGGDLVEGVFVCGCRR